MKLHDHNYVLDNSGRILKVIGDHHDDFVVGYVKYYPDSEGRKSFDSQQYAVNTQVIRSYALLGSEPDRIKFSEMHGASVTGCPRNDIEQVFDQREKFDYIHQHREEYEKHPVGTVLLDIINLFEHHGVNLSNVGITGSFLTDMHDENSDIDLTCYGKKTRETIRDIFKTDFFTQYEGDKIHKLYKRRMSHMPTVSKDILKVQESRKIQALREGIHVNVLPHRPPQSRRPARYTDMGDVSVICKCIDDSQAKFGPAFYEVADVDIVEGFKQNYIENNLKEVISWISAYSQVVQKGEYFYVKGNLLHAQKDDNVYYAVSVTPWNRNLDNKIQLIPQ